MFRTLLSVALTSLCACFVPTSTSSISPYEGTLIVDWSIELSQNESKCTQSATDYIEITVSGRDGGTFTQSCEDFATSLNLNAGDYTATAILVDSSGRARTTRVDLRAFTIYGNDTLTIPVDFPSDSFY